ncbi:MAG: hypothetical protein WD063_14960, partial [Pirellulales bacterium]
MIAELGIIVSPFHRDAAISNGPDVYGCIMARFDSTGKRPPALDQSGWFRPPNPTGLLTHDGLLNRELESFGFRFRGPKATFMVAL